MPVIKCPSCNSMISSKVSRCPKCGCIIDGERIFGEPKVYGPPPPDHVSPHPSVSPRPSDNQLVRCPECGQPSDSIKHYRLPYRYWFLYVYASTQDVEYTCCPRCMRKHILIHGFTYNILTFNILWPFWIFPWMVVQLIRSYTHGHSKYVNEILNSNN